jgi:hypothetical protein
MQQCQITAEKQLQHHATASFNTLRCATECKSRCFSYKKYKLKNSKLSMGERQLRSRSMATEVEAAPRDLESCHDSRELVCNIAESETLGNKGSNTKIEVQIGGEEEQSSDNLVNNPEKSDDNIVMFSKLLERFMESVREGFDDLKSEIHSDNIKLAENLNDKIQAENSRLVEQIESNNKRLSETLTKQFREENDKLRAELSSKLEREVTKFQKAMDKLRSDTAIEILSVSNSVEGVCG